MNKFQEVNFSNGSTHTDQHIQLIEREKERTYLEDYIEIYSLCPLGKQAQICNVNYS